MIICPKCESPDTRYYERSRRTGTQVGEQPPAWGPEMDSLYCAGCETWFSRVSGTEDWEQRIPPPE